MAKFSAGQEVRVVAAMHPDKSDLVGTTFKIGSENGRFHDTGEVAYLTENETPFRWRESELELVQESPIRTVTRRELVPGDYGIVRVWVQEGVGFCFAIAGCPHTASELRSAAMVLSQLAEFLDEDKGGE